MSITLMILFLNVIDYDCLREIDFKTANPFVVVRR